MLCVQFVSRAFHFSWQTLFFKNIACNNVVEVPIRSSTIQSCSSGISGVDLGSVVGEWVGLTVWVGCVVGEAVDAGGCVFWFVWVTSETVQIKCSEISLRYL